MSAWRCRAYIAGSARKLVRAVELLFSAPKRGETFKVDYFVFSVIVLAVLAVCLYLIRIPGKVRLTRRATELAERAQSRHKQTNSDSPAELMARRKAVLQRELKKVPTPWGWAGSNIRHGHGVNNHGGISLKEWIEHLVAEKRTVDDDDYRKLRQEALRSMLEDRFGHAVKPGEITYRKVKPPQLLDPARPADQMDNFPSGRTDAIVKKLSPQPGKPNPGWGGQRVRKAVGLDQIKKPWGW
jgi:hypothetical protein